MKNVVKVLCALVLFVLTSSMLFAMGEGESSGTGGEAVTLVFTSWRTEDIDRMNALNAKFTEAHPNIKINFQPISDQEYDAKALTALDSGVGADILFIRSYDSGKVFYDAGHLAVLNDDLSELSDYPDVAVNAWTSGGDTYAIPFVGVTHGIYYRKDLFEKYNLDVPETWAEFLNACKVLKDNGEVVFAQGSMEGWPLYEVIYSGLGANFYGGEKSRIKLMDGDMKLTDAPFVKAFEMVDQLQEYFPNGHESIDYVSMQQMFGTGQAAMFMGGSWEIGIFEDFGAANIGWFGPPPENKGDELHYCFHVDGGIAMNKNTKNKEAVITYLKWACTEEYAQEFMNGLPGFFAYTPGDYNLTNALAKSMVDFVNESTPTVRTVWEKMSAQAPSGNSLMEEALIKMYTDELTPAEAAAFVQEGLESWYEPFQ